MPQGKGKGTRDNSTLADKLRIRQALLSEFSRLLPERNSPKVLEAFGGAGAIYRRVYPGIKQGVVFEKDPIKVDALCWQRPTWAVYQGDSISLLRAGIGSHLDVDIFDIDPYGHPWDVFEAIFRSIQEGKRGLPAQAWFVVNDGARQYLRRRASAIWETPWITKPILDHYGNALELNYLDVAKWLIGDYAASIGYDIAQWEGYYCGHVLQNTHYRFRLEQQ